MKECFKCKEVKPLNNFYKHKGMKDGRLGKCIDCNKIDTKKRTEELSLDPIWYEKEKERHREKSKRLSKNWVQPTKEKTREYRINWLEKFPYKRKAQVKVGNMERKVKGNHLHHWSYNEKDWKNVIELTPQQHATIHRFMIFDEERKKYRVAVEIDVFAQGFLIDTREIAETFYNEILQRTQIILI